MKTEYSQMKIFQTLKTLVAIVGISFFLTGCYKTEKADLVVHNALIYSVDENFTTYQAMAIRDGKIIELGAEREIMNRYRADKVIDARTRSVYPGFYDAHSHFLGAARNKGELNLFGSASEIEMIERAISFAAKTDRDWIVGRGWDQNLWEIKDFPTKTILDSIFPDRPVYLSRVDGHAALVNQAALDIAGITSDTKLSDGIIVKNDEGTLTGILVDGAASRVSKHITPLSKELVTGFINDIEQDCFRAGLTTVTEAGISVKDLMFLDSLHESGDLSIGIYAMLEPADATLQFMETGTFLTEKITARSVKLFSDGALGSRGALLKAPYSDDPDNYGVYLLTDSLLDLYSQACYEYGYQLCTHAIGDSANALILNKYASVLGGVTDLRWRIEHAQVVSESDWHLFADYAIIPSMQPVAAMSDMTWAEDRLGPKRISGAYALKSLKNELGFIALGTDFPVDDLSPINNFYAAVFRKNRDGEPEGGYRMDEALTREDALRGITIWAALAGFDDEKKGSLEPGKLADFVILDTDLIKGPESDILRARVIDTYVAGKSVLKK